jgi:protein-tyrosine phosphatase
MSKASRIRSGVLAAVVLTAVIGGTALYQRSLPNHFEVVTEGVLYRSGLLSSRNLENVVREYGIKTVVSLHIQWPGEDDWFQQEQSDCEKLDAQLVLIPMKTDTAPTSEQIEQWTALLDDPDQQPILVHCKHGVVRTGAMVAIYQVKYQGKDNQAVFDAMPQYGHSFEKPGRAAIKKFILEYGTSSQQ